VIDCACPSEPNCKCLALIQDDGHHFLSSIDSRPGLETGCGLLPLNQQQAPSGQRVRLSKVKATQPFSDVHAASHSCQDFTAWSLPWLSPEMSVSWYLLRHMSISIGIQKRSSKSQPIQVLIQHILMFRRWYSVPATIGKCGGGGGPHLAWHAEKPPAIPPLASGTHWLSPVSPCFSHRNFPATDASLTEISADPTTASAPPK
jgi:hypothetical protein